MLRTKQDGERTRSRSRCYAAAIAAMIAILGVPAAGLSQVTINFEITDDVDVNSLQFSVDYSGAPAGDLANCTGPGIGFLDFSVDSAGRSATLGWINSNPAFDSPGNFASCEWSADGAELAVPLGTDFTVTLEDAGFGNPTPSPVSPTLAASGPTGETQVQFGITDATAVDAIAITVDYSSGGSASEFELSNCDGPESGTFTFVNNGASQTVALDWSDASTIDGTVATCSFGYSGVTEPEASAYALTLDSASNGGSPVTPTIGASIPSCPPQPLTGCFEATPGKSQLKYKDDTDDSKDQGQFKLKGVTVTVPGSAIGNPQIGSTDYSWCVYDANDELVQASLIASDIVGWSCRLSPGKESCKYKSKDGNDSGISGVSVKAGPAGKGAVQIKAKSKVGNYSAPALPLAAPSVTSQVLVDGGATACFSVPFSANPRKNTSSQFQVKGP